MLAIWQGDARQRPPDPVIRKHVGGLGALIKQFNMKVAELTKRGVLAPRPTAPAWPPIAITAYGGGTWNVNNPGLGANQRLVVGSGPNFGIAATFDVGPYAESFYVQDDFKATRNLQLNLGIRWDYSEQSVDQVRNNVGGGAVNLRGNLSSHKLLGTVAARANLTGDLSVGASVGGGVALQDLQAFNLVGTRVLSSNETAPVFTAGVEVLYRLFGGMHAGPYATYSRTGSFTTTLASGAQTTIGHQEALAAGFKIVCSPSQGSCFPVGVTPVTQLR